MKKIREVTRNNRQIGFKRGMNLIVSEKLKFTGYMAMAQKVALKKKYIKVRVDPATALEILLDLTSLNTFLEAERCGFDCLCMKFQRGERIYEHQIRGLHPDLVKEFSQFPL